MNLLLQSRQLSAVGCVDLPYHGEQGGAAAVADMEIGDLNTTQRCADSGLLG